MNEICRQQFINLHKQPILDDLSSHFLKVYLDKDLPIGDTVMNKANMLFSDVPAKGKLDLDVVKDSIYFFSWNRKPMPCLIKDLVFVSKKVFLS